MLAYLDAMRLRGTTVGRGSFESDYQQHCQSGHRSIAQQYHQHKPLQLQQSPAVVRSPTHQQQQQLSICPPVRRQQWAGRSPVPVQLHRPQDLLHGEVLHSPNCVQEDSPISLRESASTPSRRELRRSQQPVALRARGLCDQSQDRQQLPAAATSQSVRQLFDQSAVPQQRQVAVSETPPELHPSECLEDRTQLHILYIESQ